MRTDKNSLWSTRGFVDGINDLPEMMSVDAQGHSFTEFRAMFYQRPGDEFPVVPLCVPLADNSHIPD